MNLLASGTTFAVFVSNIIDLINNALYILIGLAIVFLFVGIVKYVSNPADKNRRTNIMWSLIALFVLVSFVGLVRILLDTIGS